MSNAQFKRGAIIVGVFLIMTGIAVLARPVVTKAVTQLVNDHF